VLACYAKPLLMATQFAGVAARVGLDALARADCARLEFSPIIAVHGGRLRNSRASGTMAPP
jgi:hypothetical protein